MLHFQLLLLVWSVMSSRSQASRLPFGRQTSAFAMPTSGKVQGRHVTGQPPYNIASVDISQQWIELVEQGKVAATVQVPEGTDGSDNINMISVRYGVRLVTKENQTLACEEFVEEAASEEEPGQQVNESKLVRSINETLAGLQSDEASSSSGSTINFVLDGDFAAQLQLVRTLRPPPSPGFSGSTTSVPPAYNSETDSFVTGPLRLELRPRVGSLYQSGMKNSWDVFHNVSPADTRGHFLLLPTLADDDNKNSNWRGQIFTHDDCNDMVHLTSSIEPAGSLFLGYNSVGAGASQNHIHCHAWPSPPLPLQNRPSSTTTTIAEEGETQDNTVLAENPATGWDCYAVSRIGSMYDICDVEDGKVEVSYLKYPVFCVLLSASDHDLDLLGKALAATLDAVGDAPHNIGFLNRLQPMEEDEGEGEEPSQKYTDVYVFARSKERSTVLPSLKLGISEMMGVFHAQSDHELQVLSGQDNVEEGPMFQALSEVSFVDEEELWDSIKENLRRLES